jgi:hypothetical protein
LIWFNSFQWSSFVVLNTSRVLCCCCYRLKKIYKIVQAETFSSGPGRKKLLLLYSVVASQKIVKMVVRPLSRGQCKSIRPAYNSMCILKTKPHVSLCMVGGDESSRRDSVGGVESSRVSQVVHTICIVSAIKSFLWNHDFLDILSLNK